MPIPATDAEFDAPELSETAKYKTVMGIVKKIAKKHQGQAVTYGYLSRMVPKGSHDVFEDVLRDAASEGVLSWRSDAPAPSAVRF